MASNYTPNYNLCQWAAEDKVLRTEFNADNLKIDQALAGKASASVVSGLQSSVSDKASQSEVNTLAAAVTQLTAALAKKGNCQIYTTSYRGSGESGSSSPNSLSFPQQPLAVFIGGNLCRMLLLRGVTKSWSEEYTGSMADVTVTWSGNSVSWYTGHANGQMNRSTLTYQVIALLQAG